MSLLAVAGANSAVAAGYDIDNSLKFEHDNSEELNFTPSSSGSNQTWTFSCWFKLTEIDKVNPIFGHYTSADNQALIRLLNTNNELSFRLVNGGVIRELKSDMLFRDTSAWWHLVVAVDTTDGTSTNRVKIYVNGSQISVTGTYPTSSLGTYGINTSGINMDIGGSTTATPTFYGFTGYMAEIHHIDGQQLAPTEFGETDSDTGIWKPIEYTGTYGTNGAYLKFSNSSSLGEDSAGSNDWSLVNITSADQATDTPTNNFATFNSLQPLPSSTTITNGATQYYINSNYQTAVSSIAVSKGKWYAEFSPDSNVTFVGFVDVEDAYIPQNHTGYYLGYAGGNQNRSVSMKGNNGAVYNYTGSATGATFGASDIVSLALDMDNRKVYWAVNGTWVNSANPSNGTNGITWNTSSTLGDAWTDVITMGVTGYSNITWKCNFGGFTLLSTNGKSDANGHGVFNYDVPTGFYSLCSKNLAEEG